MFGDRGVALSSLRALTSQDTADFQRGMHPQTVHPEIITTMVHISQTSGGTR